MWFLRYASRTTDRHRSLIVPNRAAQWEWQNNNYLNKASIPVTDLALWKFVHVFLPVRRYASADSLLAVALCLCLPVCLSLVGVLSKRIDGSSWFLASFDVSDVLYERNKLKLKFRYIYKNMGTPLW